MATLIKASSLPDNLRKSLEEDRKKREGKTNKELRQELVKRLDELKSAGTLPSGTLTNEEKMEYTQQGADKIRDRALAEMTETAEENALTRKKSDSALSSPSMGEVQRGDGSQTTDMRPGETRRGNKPEATLLEKIQYVQQVGADAFAATNENLNILGEAIMAGINSGVDSLKNNGSIGDVVSAASQGAYNSLDESAKENVNALARQAVDSKYAHVVNSKGAGIAADLVSSANRMLPTFFLPGKAKDVYLMATTFPESYIEARNNGADQKQATAYSLANAAINSGGEHLINGIMSKGKGVLGTALNTMTRGKTSQWAANAMNSLAKTPLAKTALTAVAKSAGEGAEEVVQSLLSTGAEKITYNPDAKVDAGELAYEGLLGGAMGGMFQAASLPSTYQAYRSDYDTVNNFSLAGEAVTDESEVEIIKSIGDSIVKGADEVLNDKSTDADQKQRAQYIKGGVETVLKKLDESSADIIKGNQQKYTALEKLVSSDQNNAVENLATLVRDVSGTTSGKKDAINKTIDFVRGEIQNMNNILATSSDPKTRQKATINLQNYKDVDRTLRTFRKQINKALENLPEQTQAETQASPQTEPEVPAQAETTTETASAPAQEETVETVLKGYETVRESVASKDFPEYLLKQVQTGRISQENADALDAEFEKKFPKKELENKLNSLTQDYQKGRITEEDYNAQYEQYEAELKEVENKIATKSIKVVFDSPIYEDVVKTTVSAPSASAAQTYAQPVSGTKAESTQPAESSGNTAQTGAQAARTNPAQTSAASGSANGAIARDLGIEEFDTAEEAAEEILYKRESGEDLDRLGDLRKTIRAYRAENTAESNAAADRLTEIDRIVTEKSRAEVQKTANFYRPLVKRYGIKNIVVEDMPVGQNGYYDRSADTVHLSSRLSNADIVGRLIVHEFTHRGGEINMSLADSIVAAMEKNGRGSKAYVSEEVIRAAYADQIKGKSAEEADSIVREERAAHFMERVLEDVNVLEEFKADKTFLRKILDAIQDFFARNNPDKQEQIQLRRIEKKINSLLKAANVDAKVKADGKTEAAEGDVRFSLESPVEEVGDLVAVHNLSEENLKKVFDLGGFPMPSVAIVRAEDGHEGYGDVSVVFDRDVIDPKKQKTNKVYSADAWTPTYPSVEYKASEEAEQRITQRYNDLRSRFGDDARPLRRYTGDLSDELTRNGGVEGIVEHLQRDTDMMQLYLLDSGKEKILPVEKETQTAMSEDEQAMYQGFIDQLGEDTVRAVKSPEGEKPIEYRRKYISEHIDEIRNAYKGMLMEVFEYTSDEADSETARRNNSDYATFVARAEKFLRNGPITLKTETDYDATRQAIRDAVDMDGYTAWLESIFDGAVEKTGLRNKQETFTASGKRRSWDALHYENTLENVVKAMKDSGEKGLGVFGDGNIFGASTREYKSVPDIKKDASKRLRKVTQEEYADMKQEFQERLFEIASRLAKSSDYRAQDDAMNILVEAVSKNKTRSGIDQYVKQESEGYANYSPEIVDDLISLVEDIRSMPTSYFEAKPQRAVGIDEVGAFVVPNDIKDSTRKLLDSTDAQVVEYERGNTESRLNALNSLTDLRFSRELDEETQWSESPEFSSDIDAWVKNGMPDGESFVLGMTGDVLQGLGAIENEIYINGDKIKAILEKHPEMTVKEIKKIPQILKNPVLILRSNNDSSGRQNTRLVIFGSVKAQDGRNILTALDLRPREGNLVIDDMQKVTSSYTKDTAPEDFVRKSKIVYADKKGTARLLRSLGFEMPIELLRDGYIGSISYNGQSVNISGEDFDEVFAETDDIRYSRDLDPALERELRLKELDEQLDAHLLSAASGWKREVNDTQRNKLAKNIAADIPGVTVKEVSDAIKPVFDLLSKPSRGAKDTPEVRIREVRKLALNAAETLVDNAVQTELDPRYPEFKELLADIRSTKGKSTAESYKALAEKFPEYFEPYTADLSEETMGDRIKAVKSEVSALSQNKWTTDPFEGVRDDAVHSFASRILTGFVDVSRYSENAELDIKNNALSKTVKDTQKELKQSQREVARQEKQIGKQQEQIAKRDAVIAEDKIIRKEMKKTVGSLESDVKRLDRKNENLARESAQYKEARDLARDDIRELKKEIRKQNRTVERLERTISAQSSQMSLAMEQKRAKATIRKLYQMLMRPGRKKHIPEEWREYVAEAMKQFDGMKVGGATVNASALDKILTQIKATDAGSISLNGNTDDKAREDAKNVVLDDEVLKRLDAQMNAVKLSEADAETARKGKASREEYYRLSADYMHQVNEFLKMLNGYINQTNRAFAESQNIELAEFAEGWKSDLRRKKGVKDYGGRNGFGDSIAQELTAFARRLKYESVSFSQFCEMMGIHGVEMEHIFREGQNRQNRNLDKYVNIMQETVGDDYQAHVAEGHGNKRITVSINGSSVDVSRAQLMSLYCLWQRPAGRHHLEAQGAVFLDAKGGEVKERTFRITEDVYNDLMKNLTPKDIKIAQTIQKFLSRECASWGNEASMKMYGYTMFHEDFYFPIRVAQTTALARSKEFGADAGKLNLEFSSFTNQVNPHATSAIVIDNIFDVSESHVQRMAAYNAYAPVCHDVQRMLRDGELRDAIVRAMGREGEAYLFEFLRKINGNDANRGAQPQTYWWARWIGNNAKRAAVGSSLSTIHKQYLSVVRAMGPRGKISPKYISMHLSKADYDRAYKRMVENSGAAKMKMLGYSDVGFGETLREQWDADYVRDSGAFRRILTSAKGTRAVVKGYDAFTDLCMKGAAKADERVWVRLWHAAELDTKAKFPKLSGEELTQKVTERFNEIIGDTQVVNTLLDSAPFGQRILGTGFGTFMNEPIKTYGDILVAAEAARDRKPGWKAQIGATIATVFVSNVIAEPFVSALFSALRDSEDDSEQLAEKIWFKMSGHDLRDGKNEISAVNVLSSEMADAVAGIIPAVGQIYEFVMNAVQGYSNETMEGDAVDNLVKAAKNLLFYQDTASKEQKTKLKATSDFISATATLFGIPYKNIVRELGTVITTAIKLLPDEEWKLGDTTIPSSNMMKWEYAKLFYNLDSASARRDKGIYDIMADTYKSGNIEDYNKMLAELKEIQKETTIGVSWQDINENITKHGAVIKVGSDLWNVSLQAEFHLSGLDRTMKAEKVYTSVYNRCLNEIEDKEKAEKSANGVLYKAPENANFSLDGKEIKPSLAESSDYINNVGELLHGIVRAFPDNSSWSSMSLDEQRFALEKAEVFAKSYYKKQYNSEYELEDWMKSYYGKKIDYKEIAGKVLQYARKKK